MKWEYSISDLKVPLSSSIEVQRATLLEHMNNIGADGWEFVRYAGGVIGDVEVFVITWKRQA